MTDETKGLPHSNGLHCFACGCTFGKDCVCSNPAVNIENLRALATAFFVISATDNNRPIDMGEIERALEPFSDIAQCFNAQPDGIVTVRIEFSHLRRARQALAAIKGEGA